MGYHPADGRRALSPPISQTFAGGVETPVFPVCGGWAGCPISPAGRVIPLSISPSSSSHHPRFPRLTSLSGACHSPPLVGTAASPLRDRRSPAAPF